jgi:hypothetical protein
MHDAWKKETFKSETTSLNLRIFLFLSPPRLYWHCVRQEDSMHGSNAIFVKLGTAMSRCATPRPPNEHGVRRAATQLLYTFVCGNEWGVLPFFPRETQSTSNVFRRQWAPIQLNALVDRPASFRVFWPFCLLSPVASKYLIVCKLNSYNIKHINK